MKIRVMLALSLLLALNLFAQTATPPATGDGTELNPYQIQTLDNLYWITQNSASWDKYFIQTADIDASTTSGWDGGAGFSPIGNSSIAFSGTYNGQGGAITSLTINRPTDSFVGMFGYVEGGEIENLSVDAAATGARFVGAVAGYVSFSSAVSKCMAYGTVVGDNYIGGVIGSLEDGSTLDKSGSLSAVSGERYVGGLTGRNLATVTDCYASGSVNGTVSDEGGLVGGNTSTPVVSNSFWDTQTSTLAASAGGTGKTTSEMKTLATYTSTATNGLTTPWDFIGTPNDDAGIADWWNIHSTINSGYPVLSWNDFAIEPDGDGTEGTPWQIATLNNLYWLTQTSAAWATGVYIEQTADIAAHSTKYTGFGKGFLPIAIGSSFNGSYDGKGHSITGLYINQNIGQVGLFYAMDNGGIISDLHLRNVDVINTNVGSITGGLVGQLKASTIQRCSCTGSVESQGKAGLLVGVVSLITISNVIKECWTSGTVTGSAEVGGLIGRCGGAGNTDLEMSDCYSRADVSGGDKVGGLIGHVLEGGAIGITIKNCYSTGTVSGTTNVGGLFGFEDISLFNVTLTANFWDTESSGLTDGVGNLDPDPAGVTGKTTDEMKTQSTFTDAGWDFINTWQITGTNYPYLQYNSDPALPVELNSFTVTISDKDVMLKWKTATEVNNYGFQVQRSKEKVQSESEWEDIGFVEGHGTTNSPKNYEFTDSELPNSEAVSYRLKQIDNDGKFTYSNEVEVNVKLIPTEFSLEQNYPNPFNPSTTIVYEIPAFAGMTHVSLKVYDILGNEVKILVNKNQSPGNYEVKLNADGLASGVYIYRLKAGNFNKTKKLILVR